MATIDDLAVLANVITAARHELMDRDPEDIPNKLSRAAAATGKRVPPPHQRAILAHIAADEGFRVAVRERFVEGEFDDPLGLEYLSDPAAAMPKVELAVAAGAALALESALEAETAKTAKVEAKLADSRARFDEAQKDASRRVSEQVAADKRARASLTKKALDAENRANGAADSVRSLEDALDARDVEITDLNRRIVKLNEKLAKRRPTPPVRAETAKADMASDPIGIARLLDTQERGLRTFREAHHDRHVDESGRPDLAVPKGVSSSDAASLDALIAQMPDRVIIDGYNVAGLVNPERFSTRSARDDVVNRAAKLVRETDAVVVVVFDAGKSSEGTTAFTLPVGVEVVFEGDTIADDTIATMARTVSERCVVITNDREIHDRVQRSNCVSIFSTAFVSWTEHLNRS